MVGDEKVGKITITELTNNIDSALQVKYKENFLIDVDELLNQEFLNKDQFYSTCSWLIQDINSTIQENLSLPERKREKYPVYKKYNNKKEVKLDNHTFMFEFYFNNDDKILTFTSFDKIIPREENLNILDLVFPILMMLLIDVSIYKNLLNFNIFSFTILSFFCLSHFLLFTILQTNEFISKNRTIWVNESSFHIFRKWFKRHSIPDINRIYYFITWLEIWLLCFLLIGFSSSLEGDKSLILLFLKFFILLIIVLCLVPYSINYLLKFFSLNYRSTIILTILVYLVGFINKDYWALVLLIFVVINQILSKDILFLSRIVPISELEKLEKNTEIYMGKSNEIKLKFQVNIFMIFLYLFIVFINESKLLKPLFLFSIPKTELGPLGNILFTGIERISILAIIFAILKGDSEWLSKRRRKVIDKLQILLDYISSKLYTSNSSVIPIFIDELILYPNEEIEPKELISNLSSLPSDIKIIWGASPDWISNPQKCEAEVLVIYSDRKCFKHKVLLKKKESCEI